MALRALLALPSSLVERARRRYEFHPPRYWEERAPELIRTYDNPQIWEQKGWVRYQLESEIVPDLLRRAGAASVLVVGAGCGREYEYLRACDVEVSGFDISPSMAAEARRRFPEIQTEVDSVVGAHRRHAPADAVVSSTVLTHVPPKDVGEAVESVKRLARRIVIAREITRYTTVSQYLWPHDYDALFAPWLCIFRQLTDDDETKTAELMAWVPPGSEVASA